MTNLEIIRAWRLPQIKLERQDICFGDFFARMYMRLIQEEIADDYEDGTSFEKLADGDNMLEAFKYIYGEDFTASDLPAAELELMYLSRSDSKMINRNLKHFLLLNNTPASSLTDAQTQGKVFDWDDALVWGTCDTFAAFLGGQLEQRFGAELARIAETLTKEYDPVSNYDMYEKETPDITINGEAASKSKTDSSATTNVYGFNTTSEHGVPSAETNGESTTTGLIADNHSKQTTTGKRELERRGNIGVTTGAQLVAGELDVRKKNRFIDYLFECIDRILVQSVYIR